MLQEILSDENGRARAVITSTGEEIEYYENTSSILFNYYEMLEKQSLISSNKYRTKSILESVNLSTPPEQNEIDKIIEKSDLVDQYLEGRSELGLDVLIDDRKESPGRKFNDADLIGIPCQIIIGKKSLQEKKVEVKNRLTKEVENTDLKNN